MKGDKTEINMNNVRLERLLKYVKQHIDFYSNISTDKFEDIPIVSKEIIKSNYNIFVSNELKEKSKLVEILNQDAIIHDYIIEEAIQKNYVVEWTTGTSGVPFRCVKSIEERNNIALRLWKYRLNIDKKISPKRFYPFIHTGLEKPKFDVRNYSSENIKNLYNYIQENEILCIHTTPNLLKRHILKSNLPKEFFHNKVPYIEVTGHYLSPEDMRLFEDVFNAKIFNMYGLIEIWGIAYTCKNGNMHILEDNVYVEIVDKNGTKIEEEGVIGEVVVTSLNQYIMPFIRYKTGDYGYFESRKCLCNRRDKVLVLVPERQANKLFFDGQYLDGIKVTKEILRKIYWENDFQEILFICLIQKEKSKNFTFLLNKITKRELFEKIAEDILLQYFGEIVLNFEYLDWKEYENINPKGYIFMTKKK